MKKVLFVDDEPNVLAGLRRMLHPLRREFKMDFALGGREALRLLSETAYDVLITDVVMPDIGGVELLTESVRKYPRVVRIVLSGNGDSLANLRSVTLAHQYLVKPCDAATLRATLENALNLRDILDDPSLTALMGRIVSLPSVPTVYLKLMDALRSDETPVAAIGDIIAEDLAMSAKVLQWVNSPLFGARRPFTSPREAAIYLGVDVVRAMALTESVFAQYDAGPNPCFSVEELRNHRLQVATVARELAQSRHLPQSVVNDVFLGGLMHDLGKLVLGSNFPGQYREVAACFQDPEAARAKELQLFGTTHAEVGGYLLWLWGISGKATEIVVRHHSAGPETPEGQGPPGLVALADAMVRQGARQGARDVLAPRPESLPHEVTQ